MAIFVSLALRKLAPLPFLPYPEIGAKDRMRVLDGRTTYKSGGTMAYDKQPTFHYQVEYHIRCYLGPFNASDS